MKLTSGVNFTNILCKAFTQADSKNAKKTDGLTVLFALLGSALVKTGLKELVKSTPVLFFCANYKSFNLTSC